MIERGLRSGSPVSALEAFLAARVDSRHTRAAYGRAIRGALRTIGIRSLRQLTPARLAGYRASVMGDGRATSSQAQDLVALRSFLRWSGLMKLHRLRPEEVAGMLQLPRVRVRRPYRPLNDRESKALLRAAGSTRDRAIIGILLGAGLRVAEVAALDIGDLIPDRAGLFLSIRQGKGRADRVVPANDGVTGFIRRYLADSGRSVGHGGPLFLAGDHGAPSRTEKRLSVRGIGLLIAAAARRAKIDGRAVSPHALRHTFALNALRRSANVVVVAKLLGHANLSTTQRYCDHVEMAELRRAIGNLR